MDAQALRSRIGRCMTELLSAIPPSHHASARSPARPECCAAVRGGFKSDMVWGGPPQIRIRCRNRARLTKDNLTDVNHGLGALGVVSDFQRHYRCVLHRGRKLEADGRIGACILVPFCNREGNG